MVTTAKSDKKGQEGQTRQDENQETSWNYDWMDTEESEANQEGGILASIGASVSRKDDMDQDDKIDLRAILMEINTSEKKTCNSLKKGEEH